jgi:Tfp pilus assembly protein PilO
MKRELSHREKVLCLILAIALLTVCYFKFFVGPVGERLTDAETRQADAESEITQEETKLTQMQTMQTELDHIQSTGNGKTSEVPDYNNINNVMVQLNTILGTALDYQLSFSDPDFGEELVSRVVQMTYTAQNYQAAKSILSNLYHCRYCCILSDISIASDTQTGNIMTGKVTVHLSVTFYERTDAAATAAASEAESSTSSAN